MGLHRAWPEAEIVGVDIKSQPNYPFRFVQGDVLRLPVDIRQFDFIWASPPCQFATQMSARWRKLGNNKACSHPNLIPATRAILERSGKPFSIENVVGARKHLHNPIGLSGRQFSLGVHRMRYFEVNFPLASPQGSRRPPEHFVGVFGERPDNRRLWTRKGGSLLRCAKSIEEAREAMGIDWMNWQEIKEAIPPAYSEYIARQFSSQREAPHA